MNRLRLLTRYLLTMLSIVGLGLIVLLLTPAVLVGISINPERTEDILDYFFEGVS